jgi:CO/xanthine dehydrogenase FAD-binding subunit
MIVLRPRSLEEALVAKAAHPDAVPVAGGTDLWVHWPTNLDGRDRTYLDLGRLAELCHLRFDNERLILGAGTTYWDVLCSRRCAEEFPILLVAARQIGAIQIQCRGTWAGNIANGSPAADGVAALMACDAEVVLASVRGERTIALENFYTGYRQTVAEPDELIGAIGLPRRHHTFSRFEKIGSRRAQTITKVGMAVTVSEAGWRIIAISMAPTVCRCRRLEDLLAVGTPIESPDALHSALDADLSPIDDIRSSAAYRRAVFARTLFALAGEARQGRLG